jgi:hypothetical protein
MIHHFFPEDRGDGGTSGKETGRGGCGGALTGTSVATL